MERNAKMVQMPGPGFRRHFKVAQSQSVAPKPKPQLAGGPERRFPYEVFAVRKRAPDALPQRLRLADFRVAAGRNMNNTMKKVHSVPHMIPGENRTNELGASLAAGKPPATMERLEDSALFPGFLPQIKALEQLVNNKSKPPRKAEHVQHLSVALEGKATRRVNANQIANLELLCNRNIRLEYAVNGKPKAPTRLQPLSAVLAPSESERHRVATIIRPSSNREDAPSAIQLHLGEGIGSNNKRGYMGSAPPKKSLVGQGFLDRVAREQQQQAFRPACFGRKLRPSREAETGENDAEEDEPNVTFGGPK